jgi:rhodanese-related sulfurtransferase
MKPNRTGDRPKVELVEITANETKRVVELTGGPVGIERHRNDMQLITGYLRPMVSIDCVTPVGELEVLDCLGDHDHVVIDMRDPDWRLKGTIPGSTSIPFGDVADRLDALGCVRSSSGWNCDGAKKVVAFCNGPACPQSSIAMHVMADNVFPPEKIYYYRGGMQDWLVLGLTTHTSTA